MKIVFINGSPKMGKNNSEHFISEIKRMIGETKNALEIESVQVRINRPKIDDADKEQIVSSDILVFCFPLYVDAIPSHLLKVMTELESSFQNISKKPIVYAVANCGFFEAKQNYVALDVVRNWCRRAGLEWKQGVGIGGGEMQGQALANVPCGKGPKTTLGNMMQIFIGNILNQSGGENLFANPNFPRFAYIFMAHRGWYAMARKNGIKRKDILFQP